MILGLMLSSNFDYKLAKFTSDILVFISFYLPKNLYSIHLKNLNDKNCILGANGYLGRIVSNNLNQNYVISEFTTSTRSHERNQYNLNEFNEKMNDYDLILFFCYSIKPNEQKKIESLFKKICELDKKVILISTLTIYSNFQSRYNRHKSRLEEIAKLSNHWIILRTGLVHGLNRSGIIKLIYRFRKLNFIILPGGNAKTGVVHVKILDKLSKVISEDEFRKTIDIYSKVLSLSEIFRLSGFGVGY